MREKKFRAWDKISKVMVECPRLVFTDAGLVYWSYESGQVYRCLSEFLLLDYAGFDDVGGREIWEGDLLSWKVLKDLDCPPREVEWRQSLGRWVVPPMALTEENIQNLSMEKIGNIYENPELLEDHNRTIDLLKEIIA